ncbi:MULTISPECIES: polyketide synthase [unclassified Mesorhizobium]|uniref:beta-ketoacyl [acyl carrier protein] synthase domain-containing protein n=1 Tax=unclassified Mesorhizobium TaxID=325217 RepID=UPI0033371D12
MWSDQIAVVGYSCRFPGAFNPQQLWQLLLAGGDAVSIRPRHKWLVPPASWATGSPIEFAMSHPGGFLDYPAVDGNPPIDPQQSLFLQCAGEALESAELRADGWQDWVVGVFAGATNLDYHRWLYRQPSAVSFSTYLASAPSAIPNRVSSHFNFSGPSVAVDTACSSGLVAVHLACQSLLSGETKLCLAGGVSLILTPDSMLTFLASGLLSPTGRCRVFSADADGYVRAEGCGIVALTTLRHAKSAKLPVRALVRASAVNHTGRSSNLAMPRASALAEVMLQAYSVAGVSPHDVGYLEAHAVGTQVGDILELKAIERVFGAARRTGIERLPIGSLKTNFGHSEPASGLAGLLKAIFVASEGKIPPNLHFKQLNPRARIAEEFIQVPSEQQNLSTDKKFVGVSAFGATGTNTHLVISSP